MGHRLLFRVIFALEVFGFAIVARVIWDVEAQNYISLHIVVITNGSQVYAVAFRAPNWLFDRISIGLPSQDLQNAQLSFLNRRWAGTLEEQSSR
jgi:hypothetical protein